MVNSYFQEIQNFPPYAQVRNGSLMVLETTESCVITEPYSVLLQHSRNWFWYVFIVLFDLIWVGLDWIGLDWIGLGWAGLGRVGLGLVWKFISNRACTYYPFELDWVSGVELQREIQYDTKYEDELQLYHRFIGKYYQPHSFKKNEKRRLLFQC